MSTDKDYRKHEIMLFESMPKELRDILPQTFLLRRRLDQAVAEFETYEQFIHGLVILSLRQNEELMKQLIDMANSAPRPIIVTSTLQEGEK